MKNDVTADVFNTHDFHNTVNEIRKFIKVCNKKFELQKLFFFLLSMHCLLWFSWWLIILMNITVQFSLQIKCRNSLCMRKKFLLWLSTLNFFLIIDHHKWSVVTIILYHQLFSLRIFSWSAVWRAFRDDMIADRKKISSSKMLSLNFIELAFSWNRCDESEFITSSLCSALCSVQKH